MPPETRSKNHDIQTFLKSREFLESIQSILKDQLAEQKNELNQLKLEVNNLKQTNIELKSEFIGLIQVNKELMQLINNNNYAKIKKQNVSTNSIVLTNNSSSTYVDAINSSAVRRDIKSNEDKEKQSKYDQEKNNPINKNSESIELNKSLNINNPSANTEAAKKDEWQIQKGKKRRTISTIYGKDNESNIKAAIRYKHLYVNRLEPNLSDTKLEEYLNTKGLTNVKCTKMNSKYPEEYSSFKVSVPIQLTELARDPNIWPENVCINPFFHYIVKKSSAT